ncbi:uncharacterized protein DUF1829 [Heliophilum fasciatum]|uniref:Uncharacterized protein DUF1829 n=2 Tax=Heliophilum fasciatum TaxID=35700 RepID=A0A4V2SY48_9FIRM|nr:uncharacterized protein DUF1829 [Heliophilum fasciatum]
MWIDTAINEYYKFLKAQTRIMQGTGWIIISTPFLGLFNDAIEIYCKENNGIIILSDDGKTLNDLEMMGVSSSRSQKRKEVIDKILLNYGVSIDNNGELITQSTLKDFPQKKHNLLSAIMEISDMYMLARQNVFSVFKEDVRGFLDEQDIIYTPQFISKGSTGLEFTFDFQIARKEKEIVINTFNSINKTNLSKFLFSWDDIKETRQRITQKTLYSLAIINDEEKEIKTEYLDALAAKNSDYILWSKRHSEANIRKIKAA